MDAHGSPAGGCGDKGKSKLEGRMKWNHMLTIEEGGFGLGNGSAMVGGRQTNLAVVGT